MAVSLDDDRQYKMEQLIAETIESLDGVSAIISAMEEDAESFPIRTHLHALRDVLVVCHERLNTAANMLDE